MFYDFLMEFILYKLGLFLFYSRNELFSRLYHVFPLVKRLLVLFKEVNTDLFIFIKASKIQR